MENWCKNVQICLIKIELKVEDQSDDINDISIVELDLHQKITDGSEEEDDDDDDDDDNDTLYIILGIVGGVIVLGLIVLIFFLKYKKKSGGSEINDKINKDFRDDNELSLLEKNNQ